LRIDLGGIGKGFALDKTAELLGEWREDAPDISGTLLNAGESTVLAIGTQAEEDGWRVSVAADLSAQGKTQEIVLRDRALAGSSTRVLGRHIIDPRTAGPANGALRAWASAPTATVADALSTAFMIMTPAEVDRYCQRHPDTWAILLIREGQSRKLEQFGKR
jgi:thiamine biosynthesis lipoprotein